MLAHSLSPNSVQNRCHGADQESLEGEKDMALVMWSPGREAEIYCRWIWEMVTLHAISLSDHECLEGRLTSGHSISTHLLHDCPTCLNPLEPWSP